MGPIDGNLPQAVRMAMTADDRDRLTWPRMEQGRPRLTLLGVAICSVVPAAFWCAVIWIAGHAIGMPPGAATLVTVGSCIAAFLTLVTGAVLSNT